MYFLPWEKRIKDLHESMLGLHGIKKCMSQVFINWNSRANWSQTQLNGAEKTRSINREKNEWIFENFEGKIKKNDQKIVWQRSHNMEQLATEFYRCGGQCLACTV